MGVEDIEDGNALPERIRKNEIHFTKKAVNLVTAGKNYLECKAIGSSAVDKETGMTPTETYFKQREMKKIEKKKAVEKQLFSTCSGCRAWKARSEFSDYQWNNMPMESRKCKQCINKFYKGWKWTGKLKGDAGAGWTAEAMMKQQMNS